MHNFRHYLSLPLDSLFKRGPAWLIKEQGTDDQEGERPSFGYQSFQQAEISVAQGGINMSWLLILANKYYLYFCKKKPNNELALFSFLNIFSLFSP